MPRRQVQAAAAHHLVGAEQVAHRGKTAPHVHQPAEGEQQEDGHAEHHVEKVGPRHVGQHFGVDRAHTLESLQAMAAGERDSCLLPVDALLQNLPEVRLAPAQELRFVRGQAVPWGGSPQARVRVYGASGTLLGVGEAMAEGTISPRRVIGDVQVNSQHRQAFQKTEENP